MSPATTCHHIQLWMMMGREKQSYRMWGHIVELQKLVGFHALFLWVCDKYSMDFSSGDSLAKDGRYEFMATTEAPKLTYARTASSADVTHIDESEGRALSRRRAIVSFYVALSESSLSAIRVQKDIYIRCSATPPIEITVRACKDIKAGNRLGSEVE